jgi:flagellar biosynthesis protein FliQ
MKNKRGAFTDLLLFMIVAFVIILVSGMFIYMSVLTRNQLKSLESPTESVNYTAVIDNVYEPVVDAYKTLYWLSIFMIVGMVISIFVGSYMVNTRPVFFVPYIFIVIIAVIVSVGISNAYQTLATNEVLSAPFLGDGGEYAGFSGANYMMWYLPIWIVVIGFAGGIIMFIRMKSEEFTPYG